MMHITVHHESIHSVFKVLKIRKHIKCLKIISTVLCPISNHLTQKELPVGDMVNEVLLEHVAPALDNVEQCLTEWSCIHTEPVLKYIGTLNALYLFIDLLICVNLHKSHEHKYEHENMSII